MNTPILIIAGVLLLLYIRQQSGISVTEAFAARDELPEFFTTNEGIQIPVMPGGFVPGGRFRGL